MPKLVPCKYAKLRKMLLKWGFEEREARGSHVFFEHSDGRTTVAPRRNRDLSKGLLKKILQDVELSVEQYEEMRRKI